MAPKPRPTHKVEAPVKAATSSSMKQIDEFIGQSELAPGQEMNSIKTNLQKKRIQELNEKYFD